ncbi:MAG TPA: DUF421 domain-containing protein [Clostridia bacterium]|nr:DUF421 domain-containing protein [Clostridia bacterium]
MSGTSISQLTLELVVGFFALFVVTKITGKEQINQITPFDFISAIVLGELLGNAIYDHEVKIWSILYALAVWGTLKLIMQKTTQKFRRTRKLLEGDPAIIVRNGQIDYNVLKRERLDINELMCLLRQKDVFSVREVEYAILEQSGNISVLKKSKYSVPTNSDMNLPEKPICLPVSIILDGEIVHDNLKAIGFDTPWLLSQLKAFGINDVEDVFYAEYKDDEGIHIVPRRRQS